MGALSRLTGTGSGWDPSPGDAFRHKAGPSDQFFRVFVNLLSAFFQRSLLYISSQSNNKFKIKAADSDVQHINLSINSKK